MIPKIAKRGRRTRGLLAYLYGPGVRDEHVDPHLVAAFDPATPDPGRDQAATLTQLARHLDQPVDALGSRRPARHVWHCSVRAAPQDRHLSDAEWATIAHRVVAATGIAPAGDLAGCRWAAIRHAADHIHLVATLVREDGRRPRLHADAARAQAECRRIEADFGLRRLNPGDGTAAPRPTSAERFKAERHHRPHTPREQLRAAVRQAVAGATTPEEFFTRLTSQGIRIRQRRAPSGDLLGYTVALPGDRTATGQPVWFSGSTLGPDLSWPRIHQRLTTTSSGSSPQRPTPAAARRRAAHAAWDALDDLTQGEPTPAAADQLAATGDILDALAATAPGPTRSQLRAAAHAYERASRSHLRAAHAHNRALRQSARGILHAGRALGRGQDASASAAALLALLLLVTAAHRWHAAHHHLQQAAAARQAADHLRAAYRIAAAQPLRHLRDEGRRLPPRRQAHHAATLRAALPDHADRILAEPGWFALAATLDHADHTGTHTEALLRRALTYREVDTAHSLSDVLLWRLHLLTGLDQPAPGGGHSPGQVAPPRPPAPRHRDAGGTPPREPR